MFLFGVPKKRIYNRIISVGVDESSNSLTIYKWVATLVDSRALSLINFNWLAGSNFDALEKSLTAILLSLLNSDQHILVWPRLL
jgi:hypothetical protein